jgi:hypothetical protein
MVDVRVRIGEAPSVRPDDGVEDDARAQGIPRIGTPVREEDLANPARRQLVPRVTEHADADDGHLEIVAVHLGHPPDGALRHAALADEALDARHDLGTVWQRDSTGVQLLEVAQAQIHRLRPLRAPSPASEGGALPTKR